jgi:putative membrane protein
MKKNPVSTVVLALVMSTAGGGVYADLLNGADPGQKPALPQPPDGAAKSRLNDASFVEQAIIGAMAEVEYSKLAIKKSGVAKLKQFAEQMVKDHESSNIKLKQIAESHRLPVPKTLDAEHQKTLAELRSLSGAQFDQTYVNLMKRDHDTTVGLFDNAAGEDGLSADLRNFATQALPVLRQHQQHAHALSDTEGSNAPASASSK